MIHNRLSKLTRVALFVAVLALIPVSAFAETITGTKNITTNTTADFYQVGDATTPGYLNINGGNVTFTGGTSVTFRNQSASLLLVNGTVTIANATVVSSSSGGIYANAPAGCSANYILNAGADLTSKSYPAFGADYGTSGTITVNQGAKFTSDKSFYVSGHGDGKMYINGGTVKETLI